MKRLNFLIIICILILCIGSTVTCNNNKLYQVIGVSMEPTLHDGDVVQLVSTSFSDGDIVIADIGDKLVIKRVVGDLLIGDNRTSTAVFKIDDVKILGKSIKIQSNTNKDPLAKVEASYAPLVKEQYYYSYSTDTYDENGNLIYNNTRATIVEDVPAANYGSTFTIVPGATYYYCTTTGSGSKRKYYSHSTTDLTTIAAENYNSVFPAVPGATYYYLDGSTKKSTTDVSSIPVKSYGSTIVAVPGAVYYYSVYHGGKHPYYESLTTTNPDLISTSCYSTAFTMGLDMTPDIYFDAVVNKLAPPTGTISISGVAIDSARSNITLRATINGVQSTTTIASDNSFTLSWSASSLGTGSWSNIVVSANAGSGRTNSKVYTGTVKVASSIINIPFVHAGEYTNGGAWGYGIKNAESYADPDGDIVTAENMLVYDGSTNQITLYYTGRYGNDGPSDKASHIEYNDISNYNGGHAYIGLYGSGKDIGSLTITKGIPQTQKWNYVTFTGTWTLPTANSIYKNCGGIFIQWTYDYPYWTYSHNYYVQFDASNVLYNHNIVSAASYKLPVTIVNGKSFNITLPNTGGKFAGTKNIYGGTITCTASGSNTILSGTLTSAPSTYTDLAINTSDTIQIRGVNAPSTSVATVSFY